MNAKAATKQWHPVSVACVAAIGLIAVILLMTLLPPSNTVPAGSGATIDVKSAPFLVSMLTEATCRINYKGKNQVTETVVMLQDSDSEPAMIIPDLDGTSFLCLYYADVLVRLVRVQPGKKPVPFPSDSYLNFIVHSSSCKIEPAKEEDWDHVAAYLNSVPEQIYRNQTLGFVGFQRKVLLAWVNQTLWNMRHGFIK